MTLSNFAIDALRDLQQTCGEAAASKGFHDDRPTEPLESASVRTSNLTAKQYAGRLRDWQGNKLMLIVSEVVEAHDEIRSGHAADETYYPSHTPGCDLADHNAYGMPGDAPACTCLAKPEGVPSEIADAVIRCLDFAYTEGFDLASIIAEKLAYNASREHMHGKKF
jgi:hypothetical protein